MRGTAPTPAPGATITGSSICGATIIGGTISGTTIIGGTIYGGTISGGTISQSTVSGAKDGSPETPQGRAAADSPPAAPQTGTAGSPPGQTQPVTPAKPQARTQPTRRSRETSRGASPRGRTDAKRERSGADDHSDDDGEDEDEADLAARALERALVQRGALLLPVWGFEIAPAFTYGHTSQDTFAAVADASGSPITVGARRRMHQLTGSLTARLGLPLDFQIEASMPATFVLSNVTVAGAADNAVSGFGLGDPRISLTWQMLHAGSVAPDIFIAAIWKPRVGSSPFDAKSGEVGLGTGYDAIGGTLTLVKSADPLVLLANAGYTANLPVETQQGRRNPGDAFGLGAGAILAVSPDTSLSFLIDFHYKPDDMLAGKAVLGSDETAAVLQLGLGRVFSRSVLMNVTAAIGLTADSPNFQFGISMPVRF